MTEARVNLQTGELIDHPAYGPYQKIIDEMEQRILSLTRVISDRDRVITSLRNEMAEAMGQEPHAEAIIIVLDHWADRVLEAGWWSRRPISPPASDRWKTVRARLAEGRTVEYLRCAVEGALLQRREKTKREYVDIASICKPRAVEWNFERFRDPRLEWVKPVYEAPKTLRERWAEIVDLADMCDCGHIRLDHQKPALTGDGLSHGECLVHGCYCRGWDDFYLRVDDARRRHAT